MRKIPLLAFALSLLSAPAFAADSTVSAMTAASALGGTELFYCVQGGADRKCTGTQLQTFINTFPMTVVGGTSGGIPYFSSTTALSSSALLAANALMIGGGAGVAPSTITTGTGVLTALGVNVGSAGAFVVNGGALGTPSSGTLTNATGLPISTGLTGAGTGVLTALGVNVGSAGAVVVNGGALGTPSSGTLTNVSGLPISGIASLGTGVGTALGTAVNTNGGPVTASTASIASGALLTGGGSGVAISAITPGTGVATALANAVNTNGGYVTASTASIASGAILTGGGSATAISAITPGTGVATALAQNANTTNGFATFAGLASPPAIGGTTPAAVSSTTLNVTGSINTKVRSTGTSPVTISATTDYFLCLDPTSNAITANLPGSPATGLTFLIKDCTGQAATHNITISPAAGNIDGAASYVMSTNYSSVAVTYTGSQWSIN